MRKKRNANCKPASELVELRLEVAARAYQIYLESSCRSGHDLDNWLQAEYKLLHLPVRKLAQFPLLNSELNNVGHNVNYQ